MRRRPQPVTVPLVPVEIDLSKMCDCDKYGFWHFHKDSQPLRLRKSSPTGQGKQEAGETPEQS